VILRRIALGLAVGGAVWVPAGASPALSCAAGAEGSVSVAVVIDTGTTASSPGGVSTTCVDVDPGARGTDVLDARARRLGRPLPRYDSTGLLCAIDGFPETGCGDASGSDYLYWSYWAGSAGRWYYSNLGPGARVMQSGAVEGWRFLQGNGRTTDQAPRSAAAPCPTTTTTPPVAVGPAPAPPTTAAQATRPATRRSATAVPTTAAPTAPIPTMAPASVSAPTSTTPASATAPVPAPVTTTSPQVAAPATARAGDNAGLTTVVGVGAVLSLGMAGLWFARRRATS